ncbi:NAD-dependent epimerase/dehydratase family protein [Ignatzschineria cameli]|uniref:NAD-dependent epimerase/dehydratase domain-containing protein n=1 Tax=Ignatzschineria cameli TaxID=2182793 RepID=A0A2U2AT44_9GAMM|nr:NAD-dependent epimerase/dehydratase family protein [Ignatzschineria cameli]PWD87611.1 hypothetical protein DC080_01990 [Ignatzschineria cameli]PWD87898.1 hypothetical protein DC077_01050 [Ignatzschineria cameli]PWD90466.1 hypothetical protein DC079_04840 [Ignatzschineria cameli]PWD92350.1 hypothetical protein DC081_04550 [Ignatzschineria cameli]PWD93143.1 hypothetical protein DC078_04840 [Ignatzschineria cameli]
MNRKKVCIFGGTGFVGSPLVVALAKNGYRVTVISRDRNVQNDASCLSYVEFIDGCKLEDEAVIRQHMAGSDYVINLVGTWDNNRRRATKAHVTYPTRIYEIANDLGVKKMIHFSALGAKEGQSTFFTTKAAGDKALLDLAAKNEMKLAIVAPSLVVGYEDRFSYNLARWIRHSPLLWLPMAEAKVQPLFIDDLIQAVFALLEQDHEQVIFELAGKEQYRIKEIAQKIAKEITPKRRMIIGMPNFIAGILAFFIGFIPRFPYNRNQLKSAKTGSVTTRNDFEKLGLTPASYESVRQAEMPTTVLDKYYYDRLNARRPVKL